MPLFFMSSFCCCMFLLHVLDNKPILSLNCLSTPLLVQCFICRSVPRTGWPINRSSETLIKSTYISISAAPELYQCSCRFSVKSSKSCCAFCWARATFSNRWRKAGHGPMPLPITTSRQQRRVSERPRLLPINNTPAKSIL